MSRRITAVGFIIMILSGNFWLLRMFASQEPGTFLIYSVRIGLFLVVLGGVGIFWQKVRIFLDPPDEIQNDFENSGDIDSDETHKDH
jgi:hypothetical protein